MPKSISFIFVLLFSSLRWPASFCINASVANWSASMASRSSSLTYGSQP